MPQLKETKNKKNISYELAGDEDDLTNIEDGENISGKFNKSNYNAQKLLTKNNL